MSSIAAFLRSLPTSKKTCELALSLFQLFIEVIGDCHMGLVRMGPPTELITQLVSEFAIANFVETGTHCGGTAIWASQYFKKVLTIEYCKELYEEALRKLNQLDNIKLILGDSRTELSKVLEQLEGASIFWLDAHWSGGVTYGENDQCPLLEEINIINSSNFNNFIFIDDARLFTSPPQPPHQIEQWPNITAVINELNSGNTERYIVIIEDAIIAVPCFAKAMVAHYCQEVNSKAWEEYGKQLITSNLEKRINLIYQDIKPKFKFIKKILNRISGRSHFIVGTK
jgi:hypothetical protein